MRAVERSIAAGFATPFPAMSGAEPCTGSKMPGPTSPRLAEPASPSPPVTAAASSERMSPNMFSVTITSKRSGALTSCIAALSTSMCSSVDVRDSRRATSFATRRHIREVSSTFALSTEVTLPAARPRELERAPARSARPGSGGTRTCRRPSRPRGRPSPRSRGRRRARGRSGGRCRLAARVGDSRRRRGPPRRRRRPCSGRTSAASNSGWPIGPFSTASARATGPECLARAADRRTGGSPRRRTALVDLDVGDERAERAHAPLPRPRARCSHPGAGRPSRGYRGPAWHALDVGQRVLEADDVGVLRLDVEQVGLVWRLRRGRRRSRAARASASRTGAGRSPSHGRTRDVVAPQRITESTRCETSTEARFVPKKPDAPFFMITTSSSRGLEARVDLDPRPAELERRRAQGAFCSQRPAVLAVGLEADRREDRPAGPSRAPRRAGAWSPRPAASGPSRAGSRGR